MHGILFLANQRSTLAEWIKLLWTTCRCHNSTNSHKVRLFFFVPELFKLLYFLLCSNATRCRFSYFAFCIRKMLYCLG